MRLDEIVIGELFKEEKNESPGITVTVKLVVPLVTQRLGNNFCACSSPFSPVIKLSALRSSSVDAVKSLCAKGPSF